MMGTGGTIFTKKHATLMLIMGPKASDVNVKV